MTPVLIRTVAAFFSGSAILLCAGTAAASRDVPWLDGFYVPKGQEASCRDANFEVYDWVLRFQKTGGGQMGTSDGTCGVSHFKSMGGGRFGARLSCQSEGETTMSEMKFRVDDRRRIAEIDGQPYSYCAPLK